MQRTYKRQVKERQIDLVDQHVKTILAGSFAVAVAITLVFRNHVDAALLYGWLGVFATITVLRMLVSFYYRRDSKRQDSMNKWAFLFASGSAVTGVCWGVASVIFHLPAHPELVLFLVCMYAGLVSGATASIAVHMPTFMGFLVPASLPFAMVNLLEGGAVYSAIGVMVTVFFAASTVFARNLNQSIAELYRLQCENADLLSDVQKQKEMADQNLLLSEKAVYEKNQFLAAASHDLRQPLHASGLLLGALADHVHNPQGKALVEKISSSTEALNQLFNSLLDVSRLDAGVVQAKKRHVGMRTLVATIDNDYRLQAEVKQLSYEVVCDESTVYSDPVLLERIMGNLVANAIAYTQEGGIFIRIAGTKQQKVLIEVRDTGVGIPEAELENVFSEYYQINNPERDRSKGLGLGLAIVKRLCKLLDVEIAVESSASKETVFSLLVEQGNSELVVADSGAPSIGNLAGTVVLIIDDDRNVLDGMHKLLSSWDCEILEAESADLAIAAIATSTKAPDIIFADYRLRENRTGVEAVYAVFEEINDEIPAVIITGDTSPERLREASDTGFRLLHKPVTPIELRACLQQEIGADRGV